MHQAHGVGLVTMLLVTACALPPAALVVENERPSPPPPFVEYEAVDQPLPVVPGIDPGVCPAEVAEFPEPYFGARVLIRLPAGVTADNFLEYTPGFARITGEVESTNCYPDMPGALITFMAMVMLAEDPSKSIDTLRAELLEAFGYPPETAVVAHSPGGNERSGMWVYEVPPTDLSPDPAQMLLVLVSDHSSTVAVVYEVHPNAWSVMVNTLVTSASNISLLPSP